MPGLSDTDEALNALISAVAPLPLSHVFADKLNPRPGVWNEVSAFLRRYHPEMLDNYRRLFFDTEEYQAYTEDLRARLKKIAQENGLGERFKG